MNHLLPGEKRVLAIDPTVQGVGYAVLEGATRVVDWGLRRASYVEKNTHSVRRVEELIARYEPDVLVLEDCAAEGSRRRPRVERLMKAIERLASKKEIELVKISRAAVEEAFSEADVSNRHDMAAEIARRFPQLGVWLPPVRKLWMTEDLRMRVFDAVALGLTFFYLEEEETRAA